jgi:hypothetical protein
MAGGRVSAVIAASAVFLSPSPSRGGWGGDGWRYPVAGSLGSTHPTCWRWSCELPLVCAPSQDTPSPMLKIKSFRPLTRPGSSFLLAQERRNQKEGHPMLVPFGHPVLRVRDRLRDSPTRHPCRDGERCASCTSPCGSYPPVIATPQGPLFRQRIHALSSGDSLVRMLQLLDLSMKRCSERKGSSPCALPGRDSQSLSISRFQKWCRRVCRARTRWGEQNPARKRMDALPLMGPLRSGGRWRST